MTDPAAALEAAVRAGLRRPWELIWDEAPARDFTTGETIGVLAPVPSSFRIVDSDQRLIVSRDRPENALTVEDMILIVESVNAL